MFGFCGITKVIQRNFSVIIGSANEQRARWIAETATIVRQVFDPARAVATLLTKRLGHVVSSD